MRFKQRISACFRVFAAALAIAGVFASGRGVSASEQAQTPVQPATQPAAAPGGAVLAIGVDDAVRLALQNNLGIEAERLGPQAAAFDVAQARNVYVPNLFSVTTKNSSATPPDNFLSGTGNVITSGGFRTTNGLQQLVPWGGGRYTASFFSSRSTTTGFTSFNPSIRSTLDASYTQPLLRNFKIDSFRQQLLQAKNAEQIADLDLRQRVTQLTRNVRNAYYSLVGAISGLDVAKQSLDLAKEQLKNNNRKVEVGVMAPIDILEAEAEVARVEENVIIAETQIKSAEDALRALVLNPTRPDFWTTKIEPAQQPTLEPRAIDVEAAIVKALADRTDLAALKKRVEATDITVSYLKNQKLPDLNIVANYGVVGLAGTQFRFGDEGFPPPILSQTERSFFDALRDVFGNNFRTWSLQFNLSYPIGTSSADAALASSRLQRQQQQLSIRDLEMQIATQVRDAGRQVSTSLQRVSSTRKARELAERRLEAEQKRLEVGLSDTFRVFQVQRDLAIAKRQEVQAVIDYNRSLVNFEAVQVVPGGGGF
jgi:outer membrane protein